MPSSDTQFKKGHKPYYAFKGRKHTEETKKKISEVKRGSKCHNPGALSNLWKGGITPVMKLIRTSTRYAMWRTEVFVRDDYTCIWCGARSGNGKAIELNADHIKSFAIILKEYNITNVAEAESCKELWDINNGRTLCRTCHQTTESWGRPKKGTHWITQKERDEIEKELIARKAGVVL